MQDLKTWIPGEKVNASDLNQNFIDAIKNSFTAGENITAGDAVSIGLYNPGAAITFDNEDSVVVTGIPSGSQTTTLSSFVVANQTNRVLLVSVSMIGPTNDIQSATYDGVSMTKVTSNQSTGGGGNMALFYLFAPNIGTADVVVTTNATGTGQMVIIAQSFYNVDQSVDSFNKAASDSVTLTPVADGVVGVTAFAKPSGDAITPGDNALNNTSSNGNASLNLAMGNSGIIFPNKDTISTASGSPTGSMVIGLAPLSTQQFAVVKSDASNVVNSANNKLYEGFIGFADETITAGNDILIRDYGIDNNQSGLVAGSEYFLSDTPGEISLSAGTNSKKIGIAISATEIKIKHDNV